MTDHKSPTAGMSIDIMSYDLSNKKLLSQCEPIKGIKSFQEFLSGRQRNIELRNRVLAYIIILYSKDSILNNLTQLSLRERKYQAGEMARLPREDSGEFTKMIQEDVFELKGDGIIECIFDYLKYQNNHLWTLICTNEALFDQYTYSMFKIIEVKDDPKKEGDALVKKKEMRKEMRDITQDLTELYKEFYRDHKDVKESSYASVKSLEDRARIKR